METAEATAISRATPVRSLPVRMSKRTRTLALIGGAAFILLLIVAALLPPKVPVVHLSNSSIRDEAAGTGFVRAKVTIGVGAKINGIVLKTYVDQGDLVKKGQILAELQSQDVQSQIGQAVSQAQAQDAALTSARANLAASRARFQASVSAVGKSQAGLRLAEINYGRAKSLYESAVWSKEALDSAETSYLQAKEDLTNATALRDSAQEEVRASESEVTAAERNVVGSEASVRLQKANLQFTVVTSPVDGYVVTRDLEEGGTVVPGLSIFTVAAQSSPIWVSANIDERETDGLRVGQRAWITLRSAPDRKLEGIVSRVGTEADPVTEEVVVDVAFIQPPPGLKLNETAEVYILKSEKAEAKVLPRTAIMRTREGPVVWTVADGKLQQKSVALGISDKRGFVEVVSGIADADPVLVQPNATSVPLVAGRHVRTALINNAPAQR